MKKTSDDSTGQPQYNQIARLVYALYGMLKSHTVTCGVLRQIVEIIKRSGCAEARTGVVLSSDEIWTE